MHRSYAGIVYIHARKTPQQLSYNLDQSECRTEQEPTKKQKPTLKRRAGGSRGTQAQALRAMSSALPGLRGQRLRRI